MENQLESACQESILQVPGNHWRIFLTETIDAYCGKYIMVMDVTNVFIQTNMTPKRDGEWMVIMKITGVLVSILLELDSDTYSKLVVFENKQKFIYVFFKRVIYGILVALLLFYKKFCWDLESIGFEFNTYDPNIANRI